MDESTNISKKKLTLGHHTKLKLGANNRVPSTKNSRIFSGRTVTTIEVRKKRGEFEDSSKVANFQESIIEDSSGLLTFKEQMSRINALQNANVNNSVPDVIDKKESSSDEEVVVLDDEVYQEKYQKEESVDVCEEQSEKVVLQDKPILAQEIESVVDSVPAKKDGESDKNVESSYSDSGKKKQKKVKKYNEDKTFDKKPSFSLSNDNTEKVRSILTTNDDLFVDDGEPSRFSRKRFYKQKKEITKVTKSRIFRKVLIPDKITIQELSNRMSEKVQDVLKVASELGGDSLRRSSIVDAKFATNLVLLFNHTFKLVGFSEKEDLLCKDEDKDLKLYNRPPVVTVMGHVDHGKTSLLDALKNTNVVKGEFGGITQHIGAYQIVFNDNKITFIDTPGHEAFTAMRSRGANVTDIVVLVVAADDGIMPQTIEAINHAKAANVSVIVAVNKIDKPGADVEKVINSLLKYDIVSESLGGDVIVVPVSAINKTNLDKLCEAILLIADLLDLKSPIDCRASGIVIESRIEKNYGMEATLIVQKGCLKVGDIIVVGNNSYGKIRCMFDANNEKQTTVYPSSPVRVSGFNSVPMSGDSFLVLDSEKQARSLIDYRMQSSSVNAQNEKFNIKNIFVQHDKINNLNIILKCDTMGSVEAICDSINKFSVEEIKLVILHSAVGNVTDSDVLLAETSQSIIFAFNVKVDAKVKEVAKRKNVDIRTYLIIYELFDDIKDILTGMLSPISKEVLIGTMNVKRCFVTSKQGGTVVGCYVSNGLVKRNSLIKLISNGNMVYEGKIKALRRFKDDVKEVKYGFECGILLDCNYEIMPDDVIEVYDLVEEVRVVK